MKVLNITVVNQIEWNGKSYQPWSEPNLEDFTEGTWDELSRKAKMKVKSHFLVTTGTNSNPPENFGQLKLPVVTPYGKLSKSALDNADARLNQVHGLYGKDEKRVQRKINRLQKEC